MKLRSLAIFGLLAAGLSLAVGALGPAAQAGLKRLDPKVVKKLPGTIAPIGDIIAISQLSVVATERAGVQRVTFTVKNNSASSVNWLDWQLKIKGGTVEKYLGAGQITVLDGNLSQVLTADFVPLAATVSIEAQIDIKQRIETSAVMLGNNKKSVTWTGATPPASLSTSLLDPGQATSATHIYTPRSGMTGCQMTQAPVGQNALAVNFTCTAAAEGELELFKSFALKNGWTFNGVAFGALGGGSYEVRRVSLAGGTDVGVALGIKGAPNAAPVVMVSIDLVGPANTSPY